MTVDRTQWTWQLKSRRKETEHGLELRRCEEGSGRAGLGVLEVLERCSGARYRRCCGKKKVENVQEKTDLDLPHNK